MISTVTSHSYHQVYCGLWLKFIIEVNTVGDYLLCSQRWRSSIQSSKTRPELTVAQIMNFLLPNSDLKKVGKTTRPFRYDLSQIPYDYTVEVTNRFKGLDLTDRVP